MTPHRDPFIPGSRAFTTDDVDRLLRDQRPAPSRAPAGLRLRVMAEVTRGPAASARRAPWGRAALAAALVLAAGAVTATLAHRHAPAPRIAAVSPAQPDLRLPPLPPSANPERLAQISTRAVHLAIERPLQQEWRALLADARAVAGSVGSRLPRLDLGADADALLH